MTQMQTHPAANAALRITITDTATVFTGVANLQRMDAPSARDIAAYVRNVLGPEPGGAHVHIAAAPARLAELEAALAGYHIRLTTEALPDATPVAGPAVVDRAWANEPEDERPNWVIIAVVAAVVIICAVVIGVTALNLFGRSDDAASPQAEEVGEVGESEAQPSISEIAPDPAPETVVLEQAGVRVELPAGFTLEEVDDMWRATGLDPDFRLLIDVDELYNLPAETMAEQLLRDVEADPETELVDTDGHSLTYREIPGDGSEVLWKTWPHDNHQVFVGCHTREAPTTVQLATCQMAFDSAVFEPGEGVGAMSG